MVDQGQPGVPGPPSPFERPLPGDTGEPSAGGPNIAPPPPPGTHRGSAPNPKSVIWGIAIVAVVAILVRTKHITTTEIIVFCTIIPSIILHEISHGVVALWFGDDTAKRAGRLTLNPIPHIDPVGTLLVPGLLALSGVGFFGWAKPVPVNLAKLRNPRNHGVLVSLVGPFTNMVLAAAAGGFYAALHGTQPVLFGSLALWARVVVILGLVNVGLAAFNLLPIPPLDGSVVFERLLPRAWWPAYLRIRPYTMPILLGLVLLNFYLHPGPLTWFFDQINNWWLDLLKVY